MRLSSSFLAGLLHKQGILASEPPFEGQEVQRFSGYADLIARYALNSLTPSAQAPKTLIAKVFGPRWYTQSGLPELHFYQTIAPQMPEVPVPRLLGAWDDPESQTAVLLLEDLGDHFEPVAAPVSDVVLSRMVDVLVNLHARWWDHPDLLAPRWFVPEVGVTSMPQALDRRGLEVHFQRAREALSHFVLEHQHELSSHEKDLLEKLSTFWPDRFAARLETGQNITLIHGDLHLLGNVFVSRKPQQYDLRIIDWTQAKRGLGVHDLMYMLMSVDHPDRKSRDLGLMQRYRSGLLESGISGYGWDQLVWDFRFSLLTNLWQSVFQGSVLWLRKTLEVVQVWDAIELLNP